MVMTASTSCSGPSTKKEPVKTPSQRGSNPRLRQRSAAMSRQKEILRVRLLLRTLFLAPASAPVGVGVSPVQQSPWDHQGRPSQPQSGQQPTTECTSVQRARQEPVLATRRLRLPRLVSPIRAHRSARERRRRVMLLLRGQRGPVHRSILSPEALLLQTPMTCKATKDTAPLHHGSSHRGRR